MKEILFSIGPLNVYGYGLMIAIGIIVAYLVVEYRAKKKNMDADRIFTMTLWCLFGGIIGAKLLYWLTDLKNIIADPKVLLNLSNGFVIYGAVIGGVTAAVIYCRKQKIAFLPYLDLCMPSVALAQGFGRIGCLLAGCCYGVETSSRFSIVFTQSKIAPNGVHLFPTEPLSSIFDFAMFFVLITIAKKEHKNGTITCLYMLFYSVGRFVIEFFRGDLERGSIGVLSTSQFIAIIVIVAALGGLYAINSKSKKLA